jgi:hypothetical protein
MEYFTTDEKGYKTFTMKKETYKPVTKESLDDQGYVNMEGFKSNSRNNGYQYLEGFETKRDMALNDMDIEGFETKRDMALNDMDIEGFETKKDSAMDDDLVENFDAPVFLPDFSRADRIKMFGKDGVYPVPSSSAKNNGQGDILKRTIIQNELDNTLKKIKNLMKRPLDSKDQAILEKLQSKVPTLNQQLQEASEAVNRNIDATHITSSSRAEGVIHGQGSGWEINPYENMTYTKPCNKTDTNGYCLF